ncbi:alpha-1,3-galactosyltransferase 2 isoform X2 [Salmo salar]|uniref:Alpha-1,3-galactosyltransferase 2-like isoform X2 n=1 Tax=Salmo salar TaxID=8030 RepID=A0A1S3P2A3_SALSA|nr:alpha-1,3-galactosyltransferase 2 isoform X2 [Salmo salar]XP_014021764.1 alpha-1,3-galactosyltransferase 2 isoform X2 [Salmo salar]|eukprot:XP_014021763.1 PREDICTED: alpha-1,3-galactosyltransferase 2-like isoform X2 [Salmo salar]
MRLIYKAKCVLTFAFCAFVLLFIAYFTPTSVRYLEGFIPMSRCPQAPAEKLKLGNSIDASLDLWSRGDVQTCTDWGAPVIWDGMFDPDHYDQEHRMNHSSVSLTVFAVGRYLDAYLKAFLLSAERHFMVVLPVTYYVFTDVPERVPDIHLGSRRSLKVVRVQRHSRWQDISMMRMRAIADAIESQIRHHSQYVFCFDVDQVFVGRFGSEALGDSVALLHAYYYHRPQSLYTYDRNPRSRAYMETGDFYYHAAVFGGSWRTVKNMTETCYQAIMEDKENQVEALWHDESHLNKYLWLHKPSKVLSPEYCWDKNIGYRGDIHVVRLLWSEKKYDSLRVTELL